MSIDDGGKDEAPSPADYLVCSLGSCFGMIIERYCQSHGYSSEGTEISITYMLNDKPKMIKSITADIALPEDFPDDRRKAILNSVKTCVIYNSLDKNIDIDIFCIRVIMLFCQTLCNFIIQYINHRVNENKILLMPALC